MSGSTAAVTFDEAREEMRSRAPLPPRPSRCRSTSWSAAAWPSDVRARVDQPGLHQLGDGRLRGARRRGRGRRARCGWWARAGRARPSRATVGAGEAVRISTGAELPDGVDAILRRRTPRRSSGAVDGARPAVRRRVRAAARGGRARAARCCCRPGTVVAPHEVAVVAAAGHADVALRAPPARRDRRQRRRGRGARRRSWARARSTTPTGPASPPRRRAAGAEVVARPWSPTTARPRSRPLREALDDADPPPDLARSRSAASRSARTTTSARPSRRSGCARSLFGVRDPPRPPALARRARRSARARPARQPGLAPRSASTPSARPLLGRPDDWTAPAPSAPPTRRTPPAPS